MEDLCAVEVLNHLAGGLAFSEAWNGEVFAVLGISLLLAFLELLSVDIHVELQMIVFLGGILDIHGCFLLYADGQTPYVSRFF